MIIRNVYRKVKMKNVKSKEPKQIFAPPFFGEKKTYSHPRTPLQMFVTISLKIKLNNYHDVINCPILYFKFKLDINPNSVLMWQNVCSQSVYFCFTMYSCDLNSACHWIHSFWVINEVLQFL